MRKFIFAVFAAMLLLCSTAYGVEMNLIYDEVYHYYNEADVSIAINGKKVQTKEMPPVILMDRTLVPVREVFEAVGATVSWINETSQTSISYEGAQVLFTTGSRSVYLGRSRINIPDGDPAPMIINDKTMVPVRIVANLLGFDVNWDNASRTVLLTDAAVPSVPAPSQNPAASQAAEPQPSVQQAPKAPEASAAKKSSISSVSFRTNGNTDLVYLTYNKPAEPKIARYNSPERVVLDFEGAAFTASTSTSAQGGTTVSSIRGADHDSMARIVLDVKRQPNIEVYRSDTGIVIVASPASGRYSTKIGDLQNGSVYVPPVVTSTGNKSDEEAATSKSHENDDENNSAMAQLDTTGTVDTTTSGGYDYNSVVLDAGHGGTDPGAVSGKIKESEITLAIAEKLEAKLEDAGINVIMTRSTETYVSLQQRAKIAANKVNGKTPAIFVSVHCNAFTGSSANGTQVYYDPDSKYGTVLAQNIYNANISETTLRAGQIHDGSNLYVVRATPQPAALVETAYISNSSDRAYLTSEEGQEALAQGIYDGIIETIERMKSDKGIN